MLRDKWMENNFVDECWGKRTAVFSVLKGEVSQSLDTLPPSSFLIALKIETKNYVFKRFISV
jgi:hypothetical protein